MPIRIDASLTQASGGAPPGRLGDAEPPVVRGGVATERPFLVEGERVAVSGRERGGGHTVWVDGSAAVSGIATDAGAGVNVLVGPATLRRELLDASGTVVECTLAAPALPLAAVQWAPAAGGRWRGALEVAFSVLPGETDLRYLAEGGALRAVAPTRAVEVRIHPEPVAWVVAEGADGGLGVRATVEGDAPVTLLVGGGNGEMAGRAVAAGPHLAAHEIRAAADADPANVDALSADTGVPDLDHGVVWASARVRGGLARGPGPSVEDAFWSGLGALAVGDDASARRALDTLRPREGLVSWALGEPVPAPALATLLAARYTLATGDGAPARDALASLTPDGLAAVRASAGPERWALWSLALSTLADALRHGASGEEIQALRAAAALPPGGGVRLPMLGSGTAGGAAGLLRGLLHGDAAWIPGEGGVPGAGSPLGAWALLARGDADGGYAAWRGILGRGLAGDPHGRGCWDPVTAPPAGTPQAGLLLCGLVHGLLGVSPDAPSGRIRVAPALPAQLTRFQLRNLRVGEARMTVRITREENVHRILLEPTRGRVPPMAVLEPSFPCPEVRAVRVDGAPAELEVRREGGRTRVQVQLPLDGPRLLEVEDPG